MSNKAKVRREDGKVWLEGVAGVNFGTTPNTTMGAFAAAARAAGAVDITYDYLMGVSASGFRFQISKNWCVTSPISHCGHETQDGALAAIPFEIAELSCEEDDAAEVAKIREAVSESVHRGVPVVYRNEEDGVILGLTDEGEWLCIHPQRRRHSGYFELGGHDAVFVERDWPWCLYVLGERKDPPPDARQLAIESLRLAVSLFNGPDAEGNPPCGVVAWEKWIGDLQDEARFAGGGLWMENHWLYLSLKSAHQCASAYLRRVAPLFADEPAAHLWEAAGLYAKQTEEALEGPSPDLAPCPWQRTDKEEAMWAPEWTRDSRLRQVKALRNALEFEQQAITVIEAALAATRA